jgi:hypothetical protein
MHPYIFGGLSVLSGISFGLGVYYLAGNPLAASSITAGVMIALLSIIAAIRIPRTKYDRV